MFTHDQIWAAIDRLAESRGFSASGLARQAGLDPTAFNRSKRISPNGKPRWPSTESLAKILAVTDCTMRDLLSLIEGDAPESVSIPILSYDDAKAGRNTPRAKAEHFTLSIDIANTEPDMMFALRVADNRFSPIFREGAILIAARGMKCRADDRVLFHHGTLGLRAGIIDSATKKGTAILLPDDNVFKKIDITEDQLNWTARILWSSH
jgi:phage repressor protein C with HTH and peptisase S24 domain